MAIPRQYAANHVTTVRVSFTSASQTTGITLNPLKDPEDPTVNESWQITGPQLLRFSKGKKQELIYAATASVDATTKVITLGTCTRRITWKDGATITSLGAGTIRWTSGTRVELVNTAQFMENTALLDQANTFAAKISFSGTDHAGIRHNNLTTAQREALTPQNGDVVYDTDLAVHYQYIGGAWSSFASGTTSNAANNTGGKVDLATAAEVAAGTATDATSGSPNVIPVSIVKTSSTGAANGTVPALNASVALDRTIGGLGTVTGTTAYTLIANGTTATGPTQNLVSAGTANQVLTSNGASALPTFQDTKEFIKPVFSSVTASTTLTNPTSSTAYDTHTYTIPANDLVPGVWYEAEFIATVTHGTAGTFTMGLGLGAAADVTVVFPSASGTEEIKLKALIIATAAAGASASVRYYIEGRTDDSATSVSPSNGLTANEATNGTLDLKFYATFNTSNGSNATTGVFSSIKRCSTTAA